MKRGIVFLTILCSLLTAVVASEYFYSKNLKMNTEKILSEYETSEDFLSCADRLSTLMRDRKIVNRLFYSRDTAEKITSEIEKLKVYAKEQNKVDAKAQLENIKFLYETLYRFNANAS